VLAASAAATAGGDGDAVLARARQAREQLKMWFAIDTLEYLRRGGRIGGARAWIGSALKIKPILTLEEEITPVERVRTRARSIERLRDYARQRHESGADAWVIQHIQDEEAAAQLAGDCREIFGGKPVFISEIGPVIGAHVGPGLLGVGSVTAAALE
jgi:DegV family protein with EDD domain